MYWKIESWGNQNPPENAAEIISAANKKIDAYQEAHPAADRDELQDFSEKLWEIYCRTGKI